MATRSLPVVLALGIVVFVASAASGLTLVKEGVPTCVIVTGNNPVPAQQFAAQELQYHLKEMSGAVVPIIREADLGESHGSIILVGQSDRLKALGIDTTQLAPETLIVKTLPDILILAGEDGSAVDPFKESYASSSVRTGTLYAVYDFLQDQLGCRWLWPGKAGEAIPRRATVEIGDLNIQETPKLFRRHFRGGYKREEDSRPMDYTPRYITANEDLWKRLDAEEILWKKRMKMGQSVNFAYGHAFTDWLEKYGTTQPELLALQADGHRGTHKVTYDPRYVKLCISNPKVIDIIVDDFKSRRAADPDFRFLNACENDGSWGFCRCEKCAAWDKPLTPEIAKRYADMGWTDDQIRETFGPSDRDNQPGSLSNRYFTFYNNLAKRIAEIAPDAYVVTYAYSRYRFAPIDLKLEPNLLIGFIGFNFYPMTAQQQAVERRNYMAWREDDAKQLFYRPNSFYYSFAHGIPWSGAHQMGNDIRLMIQNGIVATDYDTLNGHWSTGAPTYYAVARLQWDSQMTVDDLMGEFCDFFGPGSGAVREYFAHWEDIFQNAYARPDINEAVKQVYKPGSWIGLFKYVGVALREKDFDQGAAILARAHAALGKDATPSQLAKLHVLNLGLEHGRIMWHLAKNANVTGQDDDTDYTRTWPLIARLFKIRDELGRLGAHNTFWLTYFEVYFQDMFGTRVYQDFFGRDYSPVMTPAEAKWIFLPDPKDAGEAEGWANALPSPPEYMKREYGDRLFHRTWDKFNPAIVWKDKTSEKAVNNAWYQVDFTVPAERVQAGDVLYVPCIIGNSAKIWVNGRLIREVAQTEIAADAPVVIGLADAGIEAGKKFRLAVKVSSPEKSGGLIGPVYVARPTVVATATNN